MTENKYRQATQEKFGSSLLNLGFKKVNSLDSQVSTYVKCGGTILGVPNKRTEVNVDYYGAKIKFDPSYEGGRKLQKLICWSDYDERDTVARYAFEKLFEPTKLRIS